LLITECIFEFLFVIDHLVAPTLQHSIFCWWHIKVKWTDRYLWYRASTINSWELWL